MEHYKATLRPILRWLIIIWLILVLLAPLAELAKIVIFIFVRKEHKVELNDSVEYAYFLISFLVPWWIVTTNYCQCYMRSFTPQELKQRFFALAFVWIVISAVYTHFTKNDIGNVPSNCPSDYPYEGPKLRLACIARATNFIFMWTYASLVIVFSIAILFGILPKEEDLKEKGKDFTIQTVIEGV